jgi:copper chaperone CopZ
MYLLTLLLGSAQAMEVWNVKGMNCNGCIRKVETQLELIDGAQIVGTNPLKETLCLEGEYDREKMVTGLAEKGYEAVLMEGAECPAGVESPWIGAKGDVKTISTGGEVSLEDHLAPGKFTLYDFGAIWCSPCHRAAALVQEEMASHPDIAVRIIDLDASSETAFDLPVALQHLSKAPGIPWFVLYNPKGRRVYRGTDVDAALKVIRRKR